MSEEYNNNNQPFLLSHQSTLNQTPTKHRDDFWESEDSSRVPVQKHGVKEELSLSSNFCTSTLPRAISLLKFILKEFWEAQWRDGRGKEKNIRFVRHCIPFMMRVGSGMSPCELWEKDYLRAAGYSSDCQANHGKVKAILGHCEKLGLLVVDWKTNNTYRQTSNPEASTSHKPLLVICTEKLLRAKLVLPIKRKIIQEEARLKKVKMDSLRRRSKKDPVLRIGRDFLNSLVPPTEQELWDAAEKLVEAEAVNRHGRRYVWSNNVKPWDWHFDPRQGKLVCRVVAIDAQVESYLNGSYLRATYDEVDLVDGKKFSNRRYDAWNALPSWMRSLYRTKDGKPLIGLDAVCLFPNIVGKLFFDATGQRCPLLEGDAHQKLADALFEGDRRKAKEAHNRFWNVQEKGLRGDARKIAGYIKNEFSEVWAFRNKLNESMLVLGREVHAQLFWHSVNVEAEVVAATVIKLDQMGIPVGQCFDCIYVAEGSEHVSKGVFDDVMRERGILSGAEISEDAIAKALRKANEQRIKHSLRNACEYDEWLSPVPKKDLTAFDSETGVEYSWIDAPLDSNESAGKTWRSADVFASSAMRECFPVEDGDDFFDEDGFMG